MKLLAPNQEHYIKHSPANAVWKVHARADKKVEAIKQVRNETGMSLYDAKNTVCEYYDRWKAELVANSERTIKLPNGDTILIKPTYVGSNSFDVRVTALVASGLKEADLLQYVANLASAKHEGPRA